MTLASHPPGESPKSANACHLLQNMSLNRVEDFFIADVGDSSLRARRLPPDNIRAAIRRFRPYPVVLSDRNEAARRCAACIGFWIPTDHCPQSAGPQRRLARFSHRIISLRDDFVRRVISVLVGMRHRGVKRRERLWYFPGCVGSEELISVGLGVMPRGLRVAAARVRRARPARWRQRRDAWQRSPRYGLPDTLTPSQP